MNRKYQKPLIKSAVLKDSLLLTGSDNVGLITGGGTNASKFGVLDLWDDEEENEEY